MIPTSADFLIKSKFLPYVKESPEYGFLIGVIFFSIWMLLLFYRRGKDK